MPSTEHYAFRSPQLARASALIHDSVRGLPDDRLERRSARAWSAANILEHLSLSFARTTAGVDQAITAGTTRARAPSPYQRLIAMLVIDGGYFPKAEAPVGVVPTGLPATRVLADVQANLRALDAALALAEARFGPRARVLNHPYFGGLTVPKWRRFHWVHTRHHMKQLRRRTLS